MLGLGSTQSQIIKEYNVLAEFDGGPGRSFPDQKLQRLKVANPSNEGY